MMVIQLEDRLLDFWLDIIPELKKDVTKLDNHLKKYVSLDTNQAIRSYFDQNREIFSINADLKNISKIANVEGVNDQLFSAFFQQFICLYQNQIAAIIQQTTLISNKKEFESNFSSLLYRKMFSYGYLVLVKEMNLYREANLLQGKTDEEQFSYFCTELITSSEFLEVLNKEYPIFLAELTKIVESSVCYLAEVISNTEKNAKQLEQHFSLKIDQSLREVQFMGDAHNGGKSVCILIFNTGKLIYKPKSLKLESKFQELITYLNKQIPDTPLYEMNIFTNDTHGWCEFISHERCRTIDEMKRCYIRVGKLLALLHSLNGVDFHYENVIFNGEYPVLIDLETLLSVPLKDALSNNESAFLKASKLLKNSVFSVGLLPTKMKLSDNNAVSIGALDDAQMYEVTVPSIVNANSSKMKINMETRQIQTGHKDFKEEGKGSLELDFITYLKTGFTEVYEWILKDKIAFLNLVLKLFKDCQVRIIVKPTMVYSQLINAANHPDFLTRTIHRKIVFSRVGLMSENTQIAKSEIVQLEKGDIPYFVANFHEKHLYSYCDKAILNALLDSPSGYFSKKISSFNIVDLKRQLDFIEDAFFKKNAEKEIPPINRELEFNERFTKNQYKKLAVRIGDLLKKQAILGINEKKQKDVIWLDTSVANMDIEDWTPEVTSYDLYNGLSGLAIYFMNLDTARKTDEHQQLIKIIINMLKAYITAPNIKNGDFQSGLMTGMSGILLTIFEYAHLYKSVEDELFVETHLNKLKEIIIGNNPIDYVGGNIGALALMIKIIKKTNNIRLKNECIEISDFIILDLKKSLYQYNNEQHTTIYSGFSHGLSGVINYLYEYFTLTNDQSVYQIFKRCLDEQRARFWSEEHHDWIVSNKEQKFAYGWCHGSPGILIEKVNLKNLGYMDSLLEKEIAHASANLISHLGTNVSMCHGDLGNILILNKYSNLEGNLMAKKVVQSATQSIYQFMSEHLEDESKMSFKKFKGLMLGIAGIGDFLLKMCEDNNQLELIEYLW